MRRGPPDSLQKISLFSIIVLDTTNFVPYIYFCQRPKCARSGQPTPPKEANEKTGGNLPAFRPAAADRPSDRPPNGHPMRRPVRRPGRRRGLTAGLRPVRPSASAGPCCPEMPPGDAAPAVERRSRSAGRLENFLSKLLLRTPEGRLSSDSKRLAPRSAKKKAIERPVCLVRSLRRKTAENCGKRYLRRKEYWNGCSKKEGKPAAGAPFCRAILFKGGGMRSLRFPRHLIQINAAGRAAG